MRNLKADNQKLKVKCRNLRLNLAALQHKIDFFKMGDKKKAKEVTALRKKMDELKKENAALRKNKS